MMQPFNTVQWRVVFVGVIEHPFAPRPLDGKGMNCRFFFNRFPVIPFP